jgi:carbamoyltransferase
MIVLGINWGNGFERNHDTGVSLIKDGKIIAAINEERITGFKHDGNKPIKCLAEVLRLGTERGIKPEEIDFVALPNRNAITSYLFGLKEILKNPINFRNAFRIPVNREEAKLKEILNSFKVKAKINYVEHHLSHAAASYYFSGFEEASVITSDGIGYSTSSTVYYFNGKEIKKISQTEGLENSLGIFYSLATNAIGFHIGDGEGKTTGLACYGKTEGIKEIEKMIKIEGLKVKGNYGKISLSRIDPKKIQKKRFSRIQTCKLLKRMPKAIQ